MILTPIILEDIEHIQKANKSHERAFESIIDKVYREDKERKEKAKIAELERENKERKEELRKLKETQDKQRKEAKKLLEETKNIIEEESQPQIEEKEIGLSSTWAEVSPEQASQYMAQGTGVSADVWEGVIYRESSNNPYALNSLGCFGYLQIMQSVHGNVSSWSPQAYLDKAIDIYRSQGASAWEAW